MNRLNLKTNLEDANNQIDSLKKEIAEKEKCTEDGRVTISRMRNEILKCKAEKELTMKRLQKVELERSNLKQHLKDIYKSEDRGA